MIALVWVVFGFLAGVCLYMDNEKKHIKDGDIPYIDKNKTLKWESQKDGMNL